MPFYKKKKAITSVRQIRTDNLSPKINEACRFAQKAHKGRLRHSGKPFFHHVEETANNIIAWLKIEKITNEAEELIISALLHDCIEYEGVNPKTIGEKFGKNIQKLVEGVNEFRSDGTEKTKQEILKFIARKGYVDPRVFVIKLADRLHNMRTHQYLPKEKHIPKALETLNVYVQLAESIGMWQIKKELEDLCFSYIKPEKFKETKKIISKDPRFRENFQKEITEKLEKTLNQAGSKYQITAQSNGYYTIYQKKEKAVSTGSESITGYSHISDAVTFNIITSSENLLLLYVLMGLLHSSKTFGKFVDVDEINDYIAHPQPNKYSALQTTLNLPEGEVEIVFTTKKRFEFNNLGIITDLKSGNKNLSSYKRKIVFDENKLAWFLPLNATYLDYVYRIGVGPQAKYVIVDKKKINLKEKVENASIVKTIISKKVGTKIGNDYLNYCLPDTKILIEKQLNLVERDKLADKGKSMMEKILKPRGLLNIFDYKEIVKTLTYSCVARDLHDLYYKIAVGSVSLTTVSKILDLHKITKEDLGFCTIRVSGIDKLGILTDVTEVIEKFNGNIIQVDLAMKKKRKKDYFVLRILTKGIDKNNEEKVKNILIRQKHFDKVEVV